MASLLFLAGRAYADTGWTEKTVAIELNPTSKHYYEFRLHLEESPADCRSKNGFYQDYKSRGARQMFDSMLAAVAADLKLRVFVTGKCNFNGFAEVSSIIITR